MVSFRASPQAPTAAATDGGEHGSPPPTLALNSSERAAIDDVHVPPGGPIPGHRPLPALAFFRLRDVLRITGLSRPTLYRRIGANRFPPPVHLGGRACGWPTTALESWIADPEGYRAPEATGDQGPRRRGDPSSTRGDAVRSPRNSGSAAAR